MTARAMLSRLHPHHARSHARLRWLVVAALLLVSGMAGLTVAARPAPPYITTPPVATTMLQPGSVATMDSPVFAYDEGWTVSAAGADPSEPSDPWTQPAGVVTFTYAGEVLLLQVAQGNFWGYLYVTVDGAPANQMSIIPGNRNAAGEIAGYRTFYAPERHDTNGPTALWVLVHRAAPSDAVSDQTHAVRIEVWRSWGQTPLRGVAVDAQAETALLRWPFVAALVAGMAALWVAVRDLPWHALPGLQWLAGLLVWLTQPMHTERVRGLSALLAVLLLAGAVALRLWWLGPLGLLLLAYAALRQPALWAAALLFGLPFYYSQTLPILPGRATNLIDVGVLGGVLVACGAWIVRVGERRMNSTPDTGNMLKHVGAPRISSGVIIWIFALAGWAWVATSAAFYGDIALREWRTVFVAAALFALLLLSCRGDTRAPWLLLLAWIAGGVAVALIGLGQFATDAMLIEAEGVHRVRSLYGSPNNLALYLERTLMATLALLLLLPNGWPRWLALAAAALQGGVLLLTFSKGALILGLPAGLLALWLGGLYVLRRQGANTQPLWWLAAAAVVAGVALLPFLGTERFQRLLDFDSGTGFTRLQLWRSSLQMALDHWWLGVGPDNFLYAYRSQYILPAAWQEPDLNHPHTWLLDWWVRLGVVGMILGLGWWITGLRATWRRLQTSSDIHAALWLGTFAAMIAALAHGSIDLSYAVPDLMLVWVLLTMLPIMERPLQSPLPARPHSSRPSRSDG